MWKNLFGLSAVIASVAFFMQSIPAVEAHSGPVGISYGAYPYETFTGVVDASSDTLLTVPGDKVFIVTSAITGYSGSSSYAYYVDLLQDGTTVVDGASGAMAATTGGVLSQGQGHLRFESGSDVIVSNTTGYSIAYYIEGYYAEP